MFCLAISFSALSLHAQKKENDISALAKRADMFNQVLSQEKVYLHFDNTGYFEGETIWFKAYLTTSDDNLLGSKSRSRARRYGSRPTSPPVMTIC